MSWLPRTAPPSVRLHFLSACVLVTLVAGCSLVPPYQRPETPMPSAFEGAASNLSLDATVPVRAGWWHTYGDPALDALVNDSLEHNYSLASAIAAVEEARGTAEKVGAAQYPTLSAGATFDRSHQGGHHGSNTKSQSLFGEARYEVDFWGLNAATANASTLLARASEFDLDTVALTLTASVVDTYFSVQSLRRRLALARTIADDASRVLQLLLAQQAAGVATELQVQQQRNALSTFQAAVPALEQQLELEQHALAVLTGRAPERFAVREVPLAGIPIPQPRPGLPASLLQTRPDIRAKEAQVQSSNFDVGAARAAFLPGLVLTADGGLASKSLSRFLSSPFASIAAALAAPLFDGGALRGQLHASQGAAAKSVADYQQTVITALQEVEDSLTTVHQQELVEAADRSAADAAAKAATLAEAQYRLGTIDFLSVLDAQRTRYQAEDTLVQARLARLQASVSVFRAFGGGFGVADPGTASSSSSTNLSRS
jgi:NodT family efflux transporter outer membrane factor (OMF) lipoprotein